LVSRKAGYPAYKWTVKIPVWARAIPAAIIDPLHGRVNGDPFPGHAFSNPAMLCLRHPLEGSGTQSGDLESLSYTGFG
jgi:hypothetical protein